MTPYLISGVFSKATTLVSLVLTYVAYCKYFVAPYVDALFPTHAAQKRALYNIVQIL